MAFLPDMGRLSLACPTGMQSGDYSSAQDEVTTLGDLMALILSLTQAGNIEAACNAAKEWGATSTEARDNDALWTELTKLMFRPIHPRVRLLTDAEIAGGLSPRQWFFDLCDVAHKIQEAQARVQELKERLMVYEHDEPVVRRVLRRQRREAADNPHDMEADRALQALERKYRDLRWNLSDPLHPGVPLWKQLLYTRLLVARGKHALTAAPTGRQSARALNRMNEAYLTVWTPTTLNDVFPDEDPWYAAFQATLHHNNAFDGVDDDESESEGGE